MNHHHYQPHKNRLTGSGLEAVREFRKYLRMEQDGHHTTVPEMASQDFRDAQRYHPEKIGAGTAKRWLKVFNMARAYGLVEKQKMGHMYQTTGGRYLASKMKQIDRGLERLDRVEADARRHFGM